jgi:hypothetical protein
MDRLLSFLLFAAGFYLMMDFGCGAHMVPSRVSCWDWLNPTDGMQP